MITHDIYINRMQILPFHNDQKNVVACVHWEIIFTDGEFVSKGFGETMLDLSTPDNFTPIDQLTEDTVSKWILNDLMIKSLYDEIVQYHNSAILDMVARKSIVQWDQPLLEQKTRPTTITNLIRV